MKTKTLTLIIMIFVQSFAFAQIVDEMVEQGWELILYTSPARGVALIEKAIKINPNYAKAYYYLGMHSHTEFVLNKTKNLNKAKSYFLKAIDKKPFYKEAILGLADCYISEKRYYKAKEFIEDVLLIDSTSADAFYYLANIHESLKDFDKAIEYYQDANRYENSPRCLRYIANIYYDQKQFDKAIEYFCYYLENNPESQNYEIYLLSDCYLQTGDTIRAKNIMLKAIDDNNMMLISFNLLAEICFKRKEYTEAIKYYMESLNMDPQQSNIYLKLGNIYGLLGNKEKQSHYLNKSKELSLKKQKKK